MNYFLKTKNSSGGSSENINVNYVNLYVTCDSMTGELYEIPTGSNKVSIHYHEYDTYDTEERIYVKFLDKNENILSKFMMLPTQIFSDLKVAENVKYIQLEPLYVTSYAGVMCHLEVSQ